MAESGQKFIGRNRAPRVQIEYDVETNGSTVKAQIPFVMGVLAELSGKLQLDDKGNKVPLPTIGQREMLEIDVDNFDDRLKAMKPRLAFSVENKVAQALKPDSAYKNDKEIKVDITLQSMDDFSPAAIVKNVPALKELLDIRNKLDHLITYMDGKGMAEEEIAKMLENDALLNALASSSKPEASIEDSSTVEAGE